MDSSRNDDNFIDLSHTVEDGLVTYAGLPPVRLCDHLTRKESEAHYAPGTSFHIGKIEMISNTGTYVDSPFHRYANGKDLSELPLSALANLQVALITCEDAQCVDVPAFGNVAVRGKAVLIRTNWSKHWKTEQYYSDAHPFLSEAAARWLVERGAVFVGIDSYNIDDTRTNSRPAHSILLEADIPICEHMTNLASIDEATLSSFRLFSVPVKVKAFGTFPVRAFISRV